MRFLRAAQVALVLALSLAASFGCGGGRAHTPKAYVPLQKTAEEQYAYAAFYRASKDLVLRDAREPARAAETREAVRQHFEKVVEYFPDDRTVTPLAMLEVAEMRAGLDEEQAYVSRRNLKTGIKRFQEISRKYPDFEYVTVKALYDEALCWKKLREYDKAQEIFRRIDQTYAENKDQSIKAIATLAKIFYQQTYIR